MSLEKNINIKWTTSEEEIHAVIKLFVASVGLDYISHGEVLSGRAIDFNRWSTNLEEVLKAELSQCINPQTKNYFLLALCVKEKQIMGFAFYEILDNGNKKIGILSDLLVNPEFQGQGLGLKIIKWAETELKNRNVNHILLESGIQNKSAHHFFEKSGFKVCSITMSKKLG
jgi:GNAT superfamily N-acetyltransferase